MCACSIKRQTTATAAIFPRGPGTLKRSVVITTVTIVTGNPTRNDDQRRLPQRSAAAATAFGQRPRHINQRPENASIIPRTTKKIDIVSAISIDIVLPTSSDNGASAERAAVHPRGLSIKRLSS